jgi:hypothetical protein
LLNNLIIPEKILRQVNTYTQPREIEEWFRPDTMLVNQTSTRKECRAPGDYSIYIEVRAFPLP